MINYHFYSGGTGRRPDPYQSFPNELMVLPRLPVPPHTSRKKHRSSGNAAEPLDEYNVQRVSQHEPATGKKNKNKPTYPVLNNQDLLKGGAK